MQGKYSDYTSSFTANTVVAIAVVLIVQLMGVGTGEAPGARAPPSFQSVPYMFCTTK